MCWAVCMVLWSQLVHTTTPAMFTLVNGENIQTLRKYLDKLSSLPVDVSPQLAAVLHTTLRQLAIPTQLIQAENKDRDDYLVESAYLSLNLLSIKILRACSWRHLLYWLCPCLER